MLNKQGFDLWADGYDKTVQVSEDHNTYPFAGYREILDTIYNEIMNRPQSQVLDIGFGTGVLTSKLYENGHTIDGLDFSSRMIEIARQKMPNAHLVEWDISNGIPDFMKMKKYDFIVSTYTLHHLEDHKKVKLIKSLLALLTEQGKILIGDISFQTQEQMETCRQENKTHWDDDEFYFVYENLKEVLETASTFEFFPVSHCGAVITISNK